MPEEYQAYIQEWRLIMPDWEIRRWDESNSPMNHTYIKTAKKHKKWANISNFMRLKVLNDHGGIYLDSDMKILKPLDAFLKDSCFLGFEEGDENLDIFWVNNAIMGSEKRHPFVKICFNTLLKEFDGSEMPNESSPRLTTRMLKEHRGLKKYGFQQLEDVVLYPTPTFYPICYEEAYKTKKLNIADYPDSFAIHMWGRTWLDANFLISVLDEKQEFIAEQKKEISETQHDLKKAESALKKLNEQYNFLAEINLNNEKTKIALDLLHEDILQKINQTNHSIDESRNVILHSNEEKLNKLTGFQKELNQNLSEQINDTTSRLTAIEDIHKTLITQDSLISSQAKNISTISNNLDIVGSKLDIIHKIETLTEQLIEDTGSQIRSQTKLIDNILRLQSETNKSLVEDNKIHVSKILDLQNQINILTEASEKERIALSKKEQDIALLDFANKTLEKEKEQFIQNSESKDNTLQFQETIIRKHQDSITLLIDEKKQIQQELLKKDDLLLDKQFLVSDLNNKLKGVNKELEQCLTKYEDATQKYQINISKLQEDKRRMHHEYQEKELQLEDTNSLAERLNNKLELLTDELIKSRAATESKNKEILQYLYLELNRKKEAVEWYKRTYENRNLFSIIKDRLLKF